MELKRGYVDLRDDSKKLLIVPYGIETNFKRRGIRIHSYILIVPYGIETKFQ